MRNDISFGRNAEKRGAEEDLRFFWDQFEDLKKDDLGGLKNTQMLNEFEIFSGNIDSAMSKFVEPILGETKGFCHSSTLAFFQGVFAQSLFLKSIVLKLKGSQLLKRQYKKWKSSLSDIENSYESACLRK